MKKAALLVIGLLIANAVLAGEWLTDVPQAQEQARKQNKLVFLDFTGSDWCSWCIKLKKEVFDTKEFKEYADQHLVLVEVDFPQKKKQSDEMKKANNALQKKYGIQGYPTIIVLNAEGKKVGELGYMKGGAKPFIGELKKLKG
jgi:protein disulfide-isomerase